MTALIANEQEQLWVNIFRSKFLKLNATIQIRHPRAAPNISQVSPEQLRITITQRWYCKRKTRPHASGQKLGIVRSTGLQCQPLPRIHLNLEIKLLLKWDKNFQLSSACVKVVIFISIFISRQLCAPWPIFRSQDQLLHQPQILPMPFVEIFWVMKMLMGKMESSLRQESLLCSTSDQGQLTNQVQLVTDCNGLKFHVDSWSNYWYIDLNSTKCYYFLLCNAYNYVSPQSLDHIIVITMLKTDTWHNK